MFNIAVIGGGVIGLTSALVIQSELKTSANVTIYTEKLSPNTTGDIAAGLWTPFCIGNTNINNVIEWSKKTQDFFLDLWKNGFASEVGISLESICSFDEDATKGYPEWLSITLGWQKYSLEQLEKVNKQRNKNYKIGFSYVTLIIEASKFLPYFQNKFISNGGEIIIKKIADFNELSSYDLIINCAGLNSRNLTKDMDIIPVRGQICRVEAPWQFGCIMDNKNYIIPNRYSIILGGTQQVNDLEINVRDLDTESILQGCYNLIPALKNAKIIKHQVGLRPGRNQVRLELEIIKENNKDLKIIHNYGHGGSGITLCYGCACTVVDLIKQTLGILRISKL